MTLFGIAISWKNIVSLICFISLAYFSYLMVLITLQYVPIKLDVAFLRIKPDEISQLHYQIAFFSHVYSSIFVLILGIFQFSAFIRTQYTHLHKAIGKFYIALILFLAGPSGLVMGYYANGGLLAKISFCLLAVLWIVFTYKAYKHAINKNWEKHKNFMFRSYALTLSAISLRLFKWIIVTLFELPPMDTYIIVAWLGWVLNLVIVELLIIYKRPKAI